MPNATSASPPATTNSRELHTKIECARAEPWWADNSTRVEWLSMFRNQLNWEPRAGDGEDAVHPSSRNCITLAASRRGAKSGQQQPTALRVGRAMGGRSPFWVARVLNWHAKYLFASWNRPPVGPVPRS